MTFRRRVTLALAGVGLLPLLLLGAGVRREIRVRLERQTDERAELLAEAVRRALAVEIAAIHDRLAAVANDLQRDDRVRRPLAGPMAADRRLLLDWTGEVARRAGLAMLQLQDAEGTIVSSAHFRNDFDRPAPRVPALLSQAPDQAAIVTVRTPSGELRVLAIGQKLAVGGSSYTLAGGTAIEAIALAGWRGDGVVTVRLAAATDPQPEGAIEVRRFPALADPGDLPPGEVRFLVVTDPAATAALLRSMDRWLAAVGILALATALVAAAAVARRVSRPLETLAAQADQVELAGVAEQFDAGRDDEIGDLARLLNRMTARLAESTEGLRAAERRAATGDVARQVNHDVKNGLIPIRNVIRHLAEVAEREPTSLPAVFSERRATLESSIAHLEALARKYAGLSPGAGAEACQINRVIRESVEGLRDRGVPVILDLADEQPDVRGDAVILRRIVDNLLGNAMDAVDRPAGTITIRSEPAAAAVRVTIADTGRGMSRAELDRAFQAFHTTKDGGTGLGLAVVRQLVLELDGALRVETAPGRGTTCHLELPIA